MASSSHGTQRDTITGFLSYAVLENEARGGHMVVPEQGTHGVEDKEMSEQTSRS
jgi:hypothetical protein